SSRAYRRGVPLQKSRPSGSFQISQAVTRLRKCLAAQRATRAKSLVRAGGTASPRPPFAQAGVQSRVARTLIPLASERLTQRSATRTAQRLNRRRPCSWSDAQLRSIRTDLTPAAASLARIALRSASL